ncbi:Lrp/AsnC family transcriptional regulator [Rhodobacteraceae bacterium CCMM004]|nr:Lrp/AsnC family transcriptional regulator [Rhodobacteraceae bacterium CCMM004]
MTLDHTDSRLLNALQDGVPIGPSPFAEVGRLLDLSQDEVIDRLSRLKAAGIVTRFGPFYDAAAMGGAFCLCAMEVPQDRFDAVAAQVNAHPEVAHNYERGHRLNMWFVLATETEERIGTARARIEAETGIAVLAFPKLKEFFIGFRVAA